MAGVAACRRIYIPGDTPVIRIGTRLRVASSRRAGIGCIVGGIDMAVGARGVVMRNWKICVIKSCAKPRRCRVAGGARRRITGGDMIRH